jgi:hypothetical protein
MGKAVNLSNQISLPKFAYLAFTMTATPTRLWLAMLFVGIVANADAFTPTSSSFTRTKVSTVSTATTMTSLFLQRRPHTSNQRTISNSRGTTTTVTNQSRELLQQQSSSTSVDPEDVLPLASSTMTPEGYGFSSPIHRILKLSSSRGQYYKASASDSVTEVMDGITNGVIPSSAALVFSDDDDTRLVGIFTETDYIKVRTSKQRNGRCNNAN